VFVYRIAHTLQGISPKKKKKRSRQNIYNSVIFSSHKHMHTDPSEDHTDTHAHSRTPTNI